TRPENGVDAGRFQAESLLSGETIPTMRGILLFLAFPSALGLSALLARADVDAVHAQAAQWRTQHRTIDLHMHINYTTQHLARAVKIMDAVGLGLGVNLSGGTVTRTNDALASEFERNKAVADSLFPNRFLH